jgi:hypothetical protein
VLLLLLLRLLLIVLLLHRLLLLRLRPVLSGEIHEVRLVLLCRVLLPNCVFCPHRHSAASVAATVLRCCCSWLHAVRWHAVLLLVGVFRRVMKCAVGRVSVPKRLRTVAAPKGAIQLGPRGARRRKRSLGQKGNPGVTWQLTAARPARVHLIVNGENVYRAGSRTSISAP